MNLEEKIDFLRDFFEKEVGEVPSTSDLEKLLELTFEDDGTPVLDLDNEQTRIEVLAMFREVSFTEVTNYLSRVRNFEEMVFKSPLSQMVNTRKALGEKRDFLTRELPQVQKAYFGTCGRCKSKNITFFAQQTRSGDEAMTAKFTCQNCGHHW